MKTLIFNGSPRINGDTATMIRILEEQLQGEKVSVQAYTEAISPCLDCRACWSRPGCAIQDGMQRVYRLIAECDNIVIASPLYFSELTGPLLCLLSRLQALYCARVFRHEEPLGSNARRGGILLAGGGDGSMHKATSTARIMLRQMGCVEVFDAVCSHDTNHIPPSQDANAMEGISNLAAFLGRKG